MDLVRDLLDKIVVDRHGRELGRVDRVVLEIRDDAPPRVSALELGPEVLGARLSPLLGRWVRALEYAFGVAGGRPLRIRFSDVIDIRDHVKVNLTAGDTPGAAIDRHLRRWLSKFPGAS